MSAAAGDLNIQIQSLPLAPGVYFIRDEHGSPIYIGKARALKKRLASHFRGQPADSKMLLMRRDARTVDVIQTASEAEALLLESSLIKEHRPKYNQELKDDKSYPFLKITMGEEYPRLVIARGRKSDGSIYFGPYTSAYLLKQAISLLRRLFPMRTCHPMPKRTCLMYHIGQCLGPCEHPGVQEDYRTIVKELVLFLEGKREILLKNLSKRMKEASEAHQYEQAAVFRDQIQALSSVSVRRSPVSRLAVLNEMRQSLQMSKYPHRIEAFDISNFAGKNPVGSVVVFRDGQPHRSEYRRFKIRFTQGIDDYMMIGEIVRRRYERLLSEHKSLPDMILIDGGKGHLAVAVRELKRLNLQDLDLFSIAKQHEHIFRPGRTRPFVFPLDSAVLHIIRHVRDEAHRFAITFYRRLHKKEMGWSELDGIPGVGALRKKNLMRYAKSLTRIKKMKQPELIAIPRIDAKTAKNIEEYFKKR